MPKSTDNQQSRFTTWGSMNNLLTTTNNYVNVGTLDVRNFFTKTMSFNATTNNLLVNVQGSIDGGTNYDISFENNLAVNSGTDVTKTYQPGNNANPVVSHIRVQVKPAANNTHGTLATRYALQG